MKRVPQRKIQQEHMFVDAFYIPKWKKQEGTAGLQFTCGLFIYTLNTDTLGGLWLPTHTASQNGHTVPRVPFLCAGLATQPPTAKPMGFPLTRSQVSVRLPEFLQWVLFSPLCLRHRSAVSLPGYRSVLLLVSFMVFAS